MGKRVSKKVKIISAILAAMVLWYVYPFFDMHWAQDRCSFGHVTNAQYRAMLADARAKRHQWVPLSITDTRASTYLDKAAEVADDIRAFIKDKPTIEEKIAASHAYLRSRGAVYLSSGLLGRKNSIYSYYIYKGYFYKLCPACIIPSLRYVYTPIAFIANESGKFTDLDWFGLVPTEPFKGRGLNPSDGTSCPKLFKRSHY